MSLVSEVCRVDLAASFTRAMRELAATPTIITLRSAKGREGRVGMTATAVTALSADPPSMLLAVHRERSLCGHLTKGARICISLLQASHGDLCRTFAAAPQADRFDVGEWRDDRHGTPYLADGTNLFCTIEQSLHHATHVVFAARVRRIRLTEGGDLAVYARGRFHRLAPITPI